MLSKFCLFSLIFNASGMKPISIFLVITVFHTLFELPKVLLVGVLWSIRFKNEKIRKKGIRISSGI